MLQVCQGRLTPRTDPTPQVHSFDPKLQSRERETPNLLQDLGDLLMDHGLQIVKMPETIELSCPHLSKGVPCRSPIPAPRLLHEAW